METKTKNALFEYELKSTSITVSNDSAVAAVAVAGAGAGAGAVNVAVAGAVSVALQLAFPAVEKFCRASSAGPPTAVAIKFRKPDRVGRRGLSVPGGIFSRLLSYEWIQIWFVQNLAAD